MQHNNNQNNKKIEKSNRPRTKYGIEAFDSYFNEHYKEEWSQMRAWLGKEKTYISVAKELEAQYFIDPASYFISLFSSQIIVKNRYNTALDMCAAPGGKLLALLHCLESEVFDNAEHEIVIQANEKSKDRFIRLKQNLEDYYYSLVKEEVSKLDRNNIIVTQTDANIFGKYNKNYFDFILLDTPCTNERQVFLNKKEMMTWSKTRCKRMAKTQFSLLCAAVDSCKIDGTIIYVTCSLSPEENEDLITKILRKRNVALDPLEAQIGDQPNELLSIQLDKVEMGYYILPHKNNAAGPLFFSILKKLA